MLPKTGTVARVRSHSEFRADSLRLAVDYLVRQVSLVGKRLADDLSLLVNGMGIVDEVIAMLRIPE